MSKILTVKQILDSFDGDIPKLLADSLGKLELTEEIIRKQVPERLIRFEEGETAMVGVISDLRKDRDDEVILPEGMDDSNYSGVVLWQHDYWREDIPHARSLYRQLDPKGTPYQILAKTQYLSELSDLGFKVYEYRKAEHPLGQSIGFRSKESVRKGDTGYDDIFKEWKVRVKTMLKEKKIKASPDEFSEPYRIFTKWELWEYSDVFIGSNPDALQIAVSKGIVSNDEARLLVDFKAENKPEETDQIADLLKRIEGLEAEIEALKAEKMPPLLSLEDMWQDEWRSADSSNLEEMWNGDAETITS